MLSFRLDRPARQPEGPPDRVLQKTLDGLSTEALATAARHSVQRAATPPAELARRMRTATCPACGFHVAVPFLDGGQQPLATLAWPESAEDARALRRLPLDFVSCVECGHVYNDAFEYRNVPYSTKPNLMFNRGFFWSDHLREVRRQILEHLPEAPVVVEIGYGDGSFLTALAAQRPAGRYVGFDPHGAKGSGHASVELHQALFEPARHLAELGPDLIVTRHVLEHLTNPLGFVQQISFAAACTRTRPVVYIEVPCIDRAIESGRIVDFYYEHNSHFTTRSFTRMLARCSASSFSVEHGYDGEVVYGFLRMGGSPEQVTQAGVASAFHAGAQQSRILIKTQLAELLAGGRRVAVWGGTGKSAAFIHRYGLDAERFPVVVDSDRDKVGTCVPGTGQEIRFRDHLLDDPVDVVIIPPQWRARDIAEEMRRAGIRVETVLIEHDGALIDYLRDPHPYPRPA